MAGQGLVDENAILNTAPQRKFSSGRAIRRSTATNLERPAAVGEI